MSIHPSITAEYVRLVLDYDPMTGVFLWKSRYPNVKGWNTKWAGKEAGTINRLGYRYVNLFGVPIGLHRIAFIWMNKQLPSLIDHKDGYKSNNRWANLRAADLTFNLANAKIRKTNTSGVRGVCWHAQLGKWYARIYFRGTCYHLGFFDDKSAAAACYTAAADKYFGEFAISQRS